MLLACVHVCPHVCFVHDTILLIYIPYIGPHILPCMQSKCVIIHVSFRYICHVRSTYVPKRRCSYMLVYTSMHAPYTPHMLCLLCLMHAFMHRVYRLIMHAHACMPFIHKPYRDRMPLIHKPCTHRIARTQNLYNLCILWYVCMRMHARFACILCICIQNMYTMHTNLVFGRWQISKTTSCYNDPTCRSSANLPCKVFI